MWEDLPEILKLVFALCFVLALMGGLAFVLKKLGFGDGVVPGKKGQRLKIVEVLSLDPRRKLVLLECDDTEHLVILGPNGETVVTNNIETSKTARKS